MLDEQLGQTEEREAVNARPEALLNGPNEPLHLADVAIGRDNVHFYRPNGVANALELAVGVHVSNVKASRLIQFDGRLEFFQNNRSSAVDNVFHRAIPNVSGDGV